MYVTRRMEVGQPKCLQMRTGVEGYHLTFIVKGCVCQKWLFLSNEINFCCNEISFFTLNCFSEPKLAKTILIFFKQNLMYTLNFSVTPYFEKSCVAQHRDLFEKLFYIDIYRHCFILLLLLLLLLLNVISVAVFQLKLIRSKTVFGN